MSEHGLSELILATLTEEELSGPWHKKMLFIQYYIETARITRACAKAGITRQGVDYWKSHDTLFKQAFDQAEQFIADSLLDEAVRRAKDGVKRAVWHNGVQVGYERVYSDKLLLALLKAKRAEFNTDALINVQNNTLNIKIIDDKPLEDTGEDTPTGGQTIGLLGEGKESQE